MRIFGTFVLGIVLALGARADEKKAMPPPADVMKNIETLNELYPALRIAGQDLEAARQELTGAITEEGKKEVGKRVDTARERLAQLRLNFRTIATGVEETAYASETEAAASLDTEIKDLVKPLIVELRQMTAKPREMEALRTARETWRARLALAEAALKRANSLAANTPDGSPISEELETAVKLWSSRRDESLSQTRTLTRQIEEREASTPTMWEGISGGIATFWRSRGFNLLVGLGTGFGLFLLVRKIHAVAKNRNPFRRKKHSIAGRLTDLIAGAVAVILAVAGVVMVFYLRGDWLLLTLVAILVLGVLWASKRALPPYIEQIKLMLNLGSVRAGERLVYNDLPWRVDELNFFCEFRNPDLRDGVLRLPVKDVLAMASRPVEQDEPWFPTREGDWVKLDDATFGKIILQSPEQTTVLRLGGSRKTYRTSEYLEQNPENLSCGFRVTSRFGIDYHHLDAALTEVPEAFAAKARERLAELVGTENLHKVSVQLANAGASSLDFDVIADFAGAAAPKFNVLSRLLQECCVEVCAERKWNIPFPQLVLHQGKDEEL